MKKEPFEKLDESLMKDLKNLRDKNVPSEILKGFSASVEKRIREKQAPEPVRSLPRRGWVPLWVPAFAVLVVASVIAIRFPFGSPAISVSPATVQLASAGSSELSDEIAILRELGAWTDEDEKIVEES